jgi:hypothetical protein
VQGEPGTEVLFGDESVDAGIRTGARLSGGYFLDDSQSWCVEGGCFYVGDAYNGVDYLVGSPGDSTVARPFFNLESGAQDASLVAFPDVVEGGIGISTSSEIYSAEAVLRGLLYRESERRIDFLGGYRFLRFRERLTIYEHSDQPVMALDVEDKFTTENDFHGFQAGLGAEIERDLWTLEVLGKVGLGNLNRVLTIDGSTVESTPSGGEVDLSHGLLAEPRDIGVLTDSVFAVVPEVNVNFSFVPCDHWAFTIGYTFLALTDVLRTGDHIDLQIDPSKSGHSLIADPPQPEVELQENTLWVHGLNLGVAGRW